MKLLPEPRRLVFKIAFILWAAGGVLGAQESPQAYDSRIRETYSFPFGKDKLALPGNANTENGNFLAPENFPKAEYCGRCHAEAYAQWRQSLHSNSFRTPFYRASVNILRDSKGIEFTRHCDSCHNPIGIVAGALTKNSHVDRSFDADGLTCTTCHSIQRVQPTLGNGSYVMGVPAVMVDENGKRIPGEVLDGEIRAHPERHAQAVMQDFYRTPEFCSACHKANMPNQLNSYKWIRAFTTYDEWQNSKFSKRNPLSFYTADVQTCQNCHMRRMIRSCRKTARKKERSFLIAGRRATRPCLFITASMSNWKKRKSSCDLECIST